MHKNTLIISGFPGVGKSHLFHNTDLNVLDSDSSEFSWQIDEEGNKVRHPDFPQNYMDHIASNMGHADVILVSSHENVRHALVDANISFTLVYPDITDKDDYISRYKERGSPDAFIDFISANWEQFIQELDAQEGCSRIKLKNGEFLADHVSQLLHTNKPSQLDI